MSQETKNARREIYDFLEASGVDLLPIRGQLRRLLMEYARVESVAITGEVLVLRDKARRHRAIIHGYEKQYGKQKG